MLSAFIEPPFWPSLRAQAVAVVNNLTFNHESRLMFIEIKDALFLFDKQYKEYSVVLVCEIGTKLFTFEHQSIKESAESTFVLDI